MPLVLNIAEYRLCLKDSRTGNDYIIPYDRKPYNVPDSVYANNKELLRLIKINNPIRPVEIINIDRQMYSTPNIIEIDVNIPIQPEATIQETKIPTEQQYTKEVYVPIQSEVAIQENKIPTEQRYTKDGNPKQKPGPKPTAIKKELDAEFKKALRKRVNKIRTKKRHAKQELAADKAIANIEIVRPDSQENNNIGTFDA